MAEQIARRLVHPVHVLEHEHRPVGQKRSEQARRDTVQPRPPEGGLQLLHLAGRLDLDVEDQGEERDPGEQVGCDRGDSSAQGRRVGCSAPVQLQLEDRAKHPAERKIGRR